MKKFIIEKIKTILTVLLVLLFILFFVIQSFIGSPISLPVNKVFSRNVEYAGKEYLAIRNDNTIMLLKENGDLWDKAFYEVRGSQANNIVGPIYWVRSRYIIFPIGLRVYLNATTVLETELTIFKKDTNLDKSTFDDVGTTYIMLIIVYKDRIKFNGVEYFLVGDVSDFNG
jgi:hypothetical protein